MIDMKASMEVIVLGKLQWDKEGTQMVDLTRLLPKFHHFFTGIWRRAREVASVLNNARPERSRTLT